MMLMMINTLNYRSFCLTAVFIILLLMFIPSYIYYGSSELFFDRLKFSLAFDFDKDRLYGSRHVNEVQCRELFAGNTSHIKYAKMLAKNKRTVLTSEDYISLSQDCDKFVHERGYITSCLTTEEKEFPIAYTILMYKDVMQAERLLRAIYRPQNYYCIHIDKKAKSEDIKSIRSIANCFKNVFILSPLIEVKWGTYSVLEPELNCMKELLKMKLWKYFINLTGQEFPLKTNYELVKILQAYNGANDVEGTRDRIYDFRYYNTSPPHNAIATKGAVHIAVNRDFVEYIVYNSTANDILQWAKETFIPDEAFFTTLNHNPHLGIKGSYTGVVPTEDQEGSRKLFLTRFKNWGDYPCTGRKWVRNICILGIGDLPLLYNRPELFANKFHLHFEYFALDCLEELIYNRTRDAYLRKIEFNDTYYKNVDFVRNKII